MKLFKKKEPQLVDVLEKPLICPVCRNNLFWTRRAQMNTALTSFFKLDWTDRSAICFVCSKCTHILWFLS
jgi:uncharacterized protein YbaR (Trm112 family)